MTITTTPTPWGVTPVTTTHTTGVRAETALRAHAVFFPGGQK